MTRTSKIIMLELAEITGFLCSQEVLKKKKTSLIHVELKTRAWLRIESWWCCRCRRRALAQGPQCVLARPAPYPGAGDSSALLPSLPRVLCLEDF